MTRERLDGLPMNALLELSRKENLDLDPSLSRDAVIEELLEVFEEDRRERETLNNLITKIEQSKFSLLAEDPALGPLPFKEPLIPEAYDENRISLVLRDPTWALAIWEIRKKDQESFSQEYAFRGYGIKVFEHSQGAVTPLTESRSVFLIPITQAFGTRYIHLPVPGHWYSLELHVLLERETRLLAKSGLIFSPPELPPNPLDRKGLTKNQRRLLELSGALSCETLRSRPIDEASGVAKAGIPQPVGDWDETVFAEVVP